MQLNYGKSPKISLSLGSHFLPPHQLLLNQVQNILYFFRKFPSSFSRLTAEKMSKSIGDDIRQGLLAALGHDERLIAFPNKLLYQFEDAKPYNLDIPIVPAAVAYPTTPEQIAGIIKYASSANLKIQTRSGGHSYGNYGISYQL